MFLQVYICCCCSVTKYPTLCDPMDCSMPAFPSLTISWSLPKFMSIELVMPSNHLILCRTLLLPSIFPSIRVFSNELALPILWRASAKSIEASASASVLPTNIQGWFPLGLTVLISLQSKGLSRVFPSTTIWRHQFFGTQPFLLSSSHIHTWLLEKPQFWLDRPLSAKHCLCFLNMLSRLVITFLPRSNRLLISWLQSPSAVILEPRKI